MSTPKKRGFAAMDKTALSKIASKGGVAAHAKGVAHQWTTDQARVAGRKGGLARHSNRPVGPAEQAARA